MSHAGCRLRVYLAGPMQDKSDDECRVWRQEAEIALAMLGIEAVNPMVRDYRAVTDMDPANVVQPDIRDILSCDGVLVEARLGASWGTAMEVVYSKLNSMPVVAIVPKNVMISYWLLYHTRAVVHTVKDAVNVLAKEMGCM